MRGREHLEQTVDRIVIIRKLLREVNLDLKISALILALEKLQRIRRSKQAPLSFEDFEQCALVVEPGRMVLTADNTGLSATSGTQPIRMQAPLLLFLLLHHRDQYPVFEIIESFVGWIWKELTPFDFKKTKTGVTRCFTNTRFAANTLRGYGFLKYTQKEAFKTWELSLTGFLVAAEILDRRRRLKVVTELLPLGEKDNWDLSAEIRDASKGLSSYELVVDCLETICRRDSPAFRSFTPVLTKASDLLKEYWAVLCDASKSNQERRKVSLQVLNRLEREGIDDKFYEEFSRCVQINDALRRIFQNDA